MANNFSVAISAKDGASGVLDGINKRMAAFNKEADRTRAPLQQLATNFQKFTKVTGIESVAAGFGNVARAGFSAFQSVARIVEPLSVIAGAASVAGMMRLATVWAQFGSNLGNTANRAGLTANQLHGLQNAGRLAGVSAEALSGGMTSLRDNMVNAVAGRAPQVVGMLQALGLSANDARRYAADTTKALPELADKIAALRDPTLQAEAATTLFGGAGEQLLPFLRKGSAGIAEYTAKAERYGLINADGVAAANTLREAQSGLTMAIEGLGNSISQQLAPVIGPLLTQLADWIARNREWISQGIGEKIGKFAKFLGDVPWAKIGTDINGIMTAVDGVATALGGWVPVGEGILAFFALAWLAKMMLPLLTISRMLLKLPGEAAGAAVKANAELGKVGAGPRAPSALPLGLNMLGIASELSGGKTAQDQHDLNTESGMAQMGKAIGEALGMKFDENGKSEGLLHKWMGGGGSAPPSMFSPPAAAGAPFNRSHGNGSNAFVAPSSAPSQSSLTPSKDHADFYTKYNGAAERAGAALGVDKSVVLAHWAQETNFGKSAHDNNLGNIQAGSGYTGATVVRGDTHADGSAYQTKFRAYNTPEAFADDYSALIRRRYAASIGAGADGLKFGQGLRAGGYMENPRGAQDIADTQARVRRELAALPQPSGPDRQLAANAGTAAAPGGGAPVAQVSGQIATTLRLDGFPANTSVRTQQSGATLSPLRVERSNVGVSPMAPG